MSKKDFSFEEAMVRLEEIVRILEGGKTSLPFLNAFFISSTEGSSPSRYCIIRSSSNSQIFSTSSV